MHGFTLRSAAPALLLSVLVLAPFFGKAFTIDDPVFMREADHALQDPLHPTAFDMTWDYMPVRVSRRVPTGPVMGWLLVPSAAAGGSEWIAHAVELAMLWLGILATVSLALRLGIPPRWASASGALLVAMPAVTAMAGTAMPDVPAMALGVAGLERLVAWGRDRRPAQAVVAAALLGLAALTRSHAVLLVGAGAVLLAGTASPVISWRERLRLYLPVAGAALAVALLTFITSDPRAGPGSMLEAAAFFSSTSAERLASNAVAFPIHWVLAMAFALPWLALRGRTMMRNPHVLVALVSGTLLSVAALAHAGRKPLALGLVAGIGIAVLWDVFADAWKRSDRVQLALGLWLLVALCALPYVQLPSKLLVTSAPAAALLLARELAARTGKRPWLVLGATVAIGVALGVAILRADMALGNLGRRAAAELIAPRVAAGRRVWIVGHWGFQWYAEKAGARHVTLTPPYPQHGDFLVVRLGAGTSPQMLQMIANQFPRMTRAAQLLDDEPGGRVMDSSLGAGFYSNIVGYLPWAWGSSPVDAFLAFDL